jgi:lipopolysaccharide biosynthesis glycosyltransferase
MKLFLATNSGTVGTDNIKLLKNSINSALKNTQFDIFVIFDGKKEELDLPEKVTIIEHRHRCYETFKKSSKNNGDGFMNIASGAFLRTEIPFLCKKLGIEDDYCLYTDYDVLFLGQDYSDLYNMRPEYFAACPEFDKNNWNYINTGVMLMNINHFFENDKFIVDYINNNFDKLDVWDQTMYNNLYRNKIDKLPIEYNWKPYWGADNNSKIVHFHGAKPRSVEPEWRYNLPEIKSLREVNKSGYEYYNNIFEKYFI